MTRVALVTGGGTGIGAAVGAAGSPPTATRSCVTGRRPEPIEEVAAEIGGLAVVADTGVERMPSARSPRRSSGSAASTRSSSTPASAAPATCSSSTPTRSDASSAPTSPARS